MANYFLRLCDDVYKLIGTLDTSVDGGGAASVYLVAQNIDGGGA